FPFGFLRLIWKKRNITRMRLISTNVVPEYQRWGVGLVLLAALAPQVGKSNVRECEFSWVLESNSLSRGSLEKGGATCTKTYRLYDLEPA
ncbi:MAG: N-acetyltransferase, partial [Pirellulales bacterium]|nr:N-acetyltransferase [Pirellulales bacterium]